MAKFYWLAHQRTVADGRMRWHAEEADEAFWADYWESKVNAAYYRGAEALDLAADELGRPLLAEMSRAFSHHGVNIKQANCRAIGDGERAINTFYATVGRLEQLESLVATLKRIDGVGGVERVFSQGAA